MGQSKEPIRLRQRKTPAGLISLYLDIYLNGQRSYEYLKLYLIPETNKVEKPRDFDPFGQTGFAHLWLQYD